MCDGQCDCLWDTNGTCADEMDCEQYYKKINGMDFFNN